MYLDRACLSQMVSSDSFQRDLALDKKSVGHVLGVFFFAYALAQMPAAWLGDRFGARKLMTWMIVIWSVFTLLTGSAIGMWSLMLARIGCGLAEAGAYPCSGSLIPRWVSLSGRGRASAFVAGGGRLGGALAPYLTAFAIIALGSWRMPGWIFGAVGIAFAAVFWWVCRDRPVEHPGCNEAEVAIISRGQAPEFQESIKTHRGIRIPWRGLLTSRDMWLMCLYQFLTNVGWVFLVTLMPLFLRETKGLSEMQAGKMATWALLAGLVGMLAGGWLTDALTRRFGVKIGRGIPMIWSRVIGAGAYVLCLYLDSPLIAAAAFGMVAAMTDISVPAIWAYIQDVGGRSVASTYAWPNMWGNFGAAVTPSILTWINVTFDPNHNWHASLLFLAGAFLLSGVAALGIRADVKIVQSEDPAH
jgi:MFS family permease